MKNRPTEKKVTLEILAAMVNTGFTDVRADLKDIRTGIKGVRTDIANHDQRYDDLAETVNKLPTRDEMQQILERTYNLSVMKAEHDRMKKIIHEKLQVEV